MVALDLDKIEKDRLREVDKKSKFRTDEIFTSERVVSALDTNVAVVRSYDTDELMAMLPFSSNLFVTICPACVSRNDLEGFKKFSTRGAIIPVLTSPYRFYPEYITDFLSSHDHISAYAFRFYKQLVLRSEESRGVCGHCVEKVTTQAMDYVREKKNIDEFRESLDRIQRNLWPFIRPDFQLVEASVDACKRGSIRDLRQLEKVSGGVNAVRTAQVFAAPILLRSDEFDKLPEGIVREDDAADRVRVEMQKYALNGLGLRVPTNINLDEYIELVSDYRPAITKIVSGVTDVACSEVGSVSMSDVQREVMRINSEIERIKGLRRSIVLDACVGFYRDNPKLTTASLIMCALGLSNHLLGCAVTGGVQVAREIKSRISGRDQSEEGKRLRSVVKRDSLPFVDSLIAAYVNSDARSVSVLSLRKIFEKRVTKSPPKARQLRKP
jgi:hypothetical protein